MPALAEPPTPVVDRRVARTRRRLHAAIVELCLRRGFRSITVDDLLDHADVTRATFYTHFRDKEHLLESVAEQVVDDVLVEFATTSLTGADRLSCLFAQAQRDPDRLRVVLRGEGDGVALRRLTRRVVEVIRSVDEANAAVGRLLAPLNPDLLAHAFAGQIVATLSWWLELDERPPAEDVVAALHRLSSTGRLDHTRINQEEPLP